MLRELILEGRLPVPANLAFHVVFIVMSVAALLTRSETVHKIFAAVMSLLFVGYTAALFARL
ncbi:hypothetical protein G7076_11225 [Sphingomonas sp. HDW15A]|uniref:hypothetical protein n=1 Tax=Sphingomonas sp. HDW15A TaxID=2714942 RepID=UPI00140B7CB3|nr:hypothetical protein [Sphingomonas sp. HDW15A]QIK96917.1 hypothetical protein G7076_11225 [Sphingomonas sp. HDW15A]